jgi:hypothetical protein
MLWSQWYKQKTRHARVFVWRVLKIAWYPVGYHSAWTLTVFLHTGSRKGLQQQRKNDVNKTTNRMPVTRIAALLWLSRNCPRRTLTEQVIRKNKNVISVLGIMHLILMFRIVMVDGLP